MSNTALATTTTNRDEPSLAKGLLAGLAGGLVATAAKTLAEKIYPPRVEGQPEPPILFAEKFFGQNLDWAAKLAAGESIHWTFGALVGAAYGVVAEYYPAATSKEGASFGLALSTLTHQAVLPAMGLSVPPGDMSSRETASEMGTHIVFGLVTELVRKTVRKQL